MSAGAEDSNTEKTETVGLTKEEIQVIKALRRAKSCQNADLLVSFQDGKKIKLWITEKMK